MTIIEHIWAKFDGRGGLIQSILRPMTDYRRDMKAYLRMAPEAHRAAMQGLVNHIAQALAQADALGCERIAIYLATAQELAEAAAERCGAARRPN